MATVGQELFVLLVFFTELAVTEALEYCESKYWCDHGHCCGEGRCCTYYYEMWWFWVVWVVISLLGCCCYYQQKRLRRRRDLSRHSEQNRTRSSTNQNRNSTRFYQPLFDPNKMLYLPSYDEIKDSPKDPPSYDLLYETTLPETPLLGATESESDDALLDVGSEPCVSHSLGSTLDGPSTSRANEPMVHSVEDLNMDISDCQAANLLDNIELEDPPMERLSGRLEFLPSPAKSCHK